MSTFLITFEQPPQLLAIEIGFLDDPADPVVAAVVGRYLRDVLPDDTVEVHIDAAARTGTATISGRHDAARFAIAATPDRAARTCRSCGLGDWEIGRLTGWAHDPVVEAELGPICSRCWVFGAPP